MTTNFSAAADAVLDGVVTSTPRVPGVVAMVTDRHRNIYEGAAGKRRLDQPADMTTDSVFAIFSTTKAITGTAVLQLVEEGKLDLDAPARRYAPEIGKLQVIEGFAANGEPILRAPKRDITTRMLMVHTAGLSYDFINHTYNRLAEERGQPSVITASKACLMTPLLFDPGERWEYGTNLDWCGQIVEAITGSRLGDVFKARIFEPLGMRDTTFELTDQMRKKLAGIHARNADGSLTPMDFELPAKPEVHMGGHGLYGTVGDYMRFIRMWLNDGMGEHGRVLKAETVRMAEKNHLGESKVTPITGVIVLGHPDSSLRRSGVVHWLHELRDRVLREPEAAKGGLKPVRKQRLREGLPCRRHWSHAFTEGRSATRAIQATMLALAVSSGWPTWPAKSSQP
jgi:methyl acetate hydrolase